MAREYKGRSGVTVIHLFNKEWRIGRIQNKTGKPAHVVIYGPDDKEYHATGTSATWIAGDNGRNNIDRARAKIWILTNVFDTPDFWNFNTSTGPSVGSSVKVIYENGTIKAIENFSGDWQNHRLEIPERVPMRLNPEWESWHHKIKKDGEEMPSQFLWEDRTRYLNAIAWKQ
jgi:hypothetical protein